MIHDDVTGRPVTVATTAAAAAWDRAVEGWLRFAPDVLERLDAVIDEDEGMVAAHTLRSWSMLQSFDPALDDAVEASLCAAELAAADTTAGERGHLAAVRAAAAGDHGRAAARWHGVLAADPDDLVAVRCCYFGHYERGDAESTRQVATDALEAWSPMDPWQPVVQGMAAFALSELGVGDEAEVLGRDAAARAPWDLWSVHAVTHVLEDARRPVEGSRWLDDHEAQLPPSIGFARHLWWHRALFALQLGDVDAALGLFDGAVRTGGTAGHLDLTNAISLLARLQLAGVDVGGRWEPLVAASTDRLDHHRSLFVHAHVALAQAWGGGDPTAAERSMAEWARRDELAHELGLPLTRAVVAWRPGPGAPSTRLPAAAVARLHRLGGSAAQRRLFAPLHEEP